MKMTASKKESGEDEDRPTTSRRYASGVSIRDSEDIEDERDGKGSKSVSTTSQNSPREQDEEKVATANAKNSKGRGNKRINLRISKASKRGRRAVGTRGRRQVKKFHRRPVYDTSESTVFSKITSISSNGITCCKYCGHRCCRSSPKRISPKMKNLEGIRKKNLYSTKDNRKKTDSKRLQVGSPCKMFSPLFVKCNLTLGETTNEVADEEVFHQITPEIVCQAVKRLTMWRDSVPTTRICNFIRTNYPVNPNCGVLMKELRVQLELAKKLDMIQYVEIDMWKPKRENKALSKTHLTKFWEIYGDTMSPVKKLQ